VSGMRYTRLLTALLISCAVAATYTVAASAKVPRNLRAQLSNINAQCQAIGEPDSRCAMGPFVKKTLASISINDPGLKKQWNAELALFRRTSVLCGFLRPSPPDGRLEIAEVDLAATQTTFKCQWNEPFSTPNVVLSIALPRAGQKMPPIPSCPACEQFSGGYRLTGQYEKQRNGDLYGGSGVFTPRGWVGIARRSTKSDFLAHRQSDLSMVRQICRVLGLPS